MVRTATNVLLFYPNLIGYVRVLCMILSFYFATSNPTFTIVFYLAAFGGDVVDGFVARAFNQCSSFGGVLDMVTDRVSTCGFLVILSNLLPEYSFVFIMLLVLDVASHWFHVISVTAHHKSTESLKHRNPLLQWYYSIYPLFGYCCVGTEMFYVLLYANIKFPTPWVEKLCFYVCLPACVLKQLVNIVQLASAADAIASKDANDYNKEHVN